MLLQARFSLCSHCDLFLFNSSYSVSSSKHVSVHGGAEFTRLLKFNHQVCHFMTKIGIAPLENSVIGTALLKRALGSNSFTWQWFLLRKVRVDSCYFHKSSCLRNVILDIPFLTQAMDPSSCLMCHSQTGSSIWEARWGNLWQWSVHPAFCFPCASSQIVHTYPFLAYNWFSICCDLVPTLT